MRKIIFLLAGFLPVVPAALSQTAYQQPASDVVAIVDAKPTPIASISPKRTALLLTGYTPNPGIATLAQPFLKLAGLRVNPVLNSRQRLTDYTSLEVLWFEKNLTVSMMLPKEGRLSGVPAWSPNGKLLAFGWEVERPSARVELWVADAMTGRCRPLGDLALNDVLGPAFQWMEDSDHLLVRHVPSGRGSAPNAQPVPTGPVVEEAAGKMSQLMTFQDLLRNETDEKLFEYYATSQLTIVEVASGKKQALGTPALYTGASWSPDERFILVSTLLRPFSYRVPFGNFTRQTEVWDPAGRRVRLVAEFPVTDEIPRQGVVTGPRNFQWQPLHPASLLWVEALDNGDPKRKADFRDRIMAQEAPFIAEPRELLKTVHRFSGFDWLALPNQALLTEFDRDRRWSTTYRLDLQKPGQKDTLFDLSVNDDYNNPGNPVYDRRPDGDLVMVQDGDWVYYSSRGASPQGERPRLDRINLKTGEKTTVFQSSDQAFEEFIAFAGGSVTTMITRNQSKTIPPNYFLNDLKNGLRTGLTSFKDPAPQLTGVIKRLIQYKRSDGVPLSGTLYLPPNYQAGQRLPLFIWAYPQEFSDAATAGQVRGSDNTFTFYRNDSPLFFVTQGYAVLMDATMPVVGDPETMNNTFVEQIVGSGRGAIDYLDSLGIIDRNRVGVGGHSYGAFMTANLLAHSDDYAFGIARSGAYNRSLTPFGFQSERRSYWEAMDIYQNLSPFTHANKINEPLLLIHGEADNNPGTHTMQSERLFQAIRGNGGTARLVLLPHESHGYRARESVLHVLSEMFNWADRYGKRKEVRP